MNTATRAYHQIEAKVFELKHEAWKMGEMMRFVKIPELKGIAAVDAGVLASRLRTLADDFDALATSTEKETT